MTKNKFYIGLIALGILVASFVGGNWSTGYADTIPTLPTLPTIPTIPGITNLVPTIIGVGGPQFEITIVGQNFIDPINTLVRWLGPDYQYVYLTTTFVSPDGSNLKANVPAALITQKGGAYLWVVNHPGTFTDLEIAGPIRLTIGNLVYIPVIRK